MQMCIVVHNQMCFFSPPSLQAETMDCLDRMFYTLWRWNSGTLHDGKEEIQKYSVYQLQRQKGAKSMQCSSLLAKQGFQVMHSELNGKSTLVWFLKQQKIYKVYISFHFCSVVCFLVLLVQEVYFINIFSQINAESRSLILQLALNA